MRFYLLPTGKVKSVHIVSDMQGATGGDVQKGFTLKAIREAPIPPMPKEIRADYQEEALELIFNFYF